MRTLKGRGAAGAGAMGMQPGNVIAIVLPADAILKAAQQVPPLSSDKPKEQN